jgi:hypothetical protein
LLAPLPQSSLADFRIRHRRPPPAQLGLTPPLRPCGVHLP